MSYRFDETREVILLKVYEYYRDSETTSSLTKNDISVLAPPDISPMFAERVVDNLQENEYLIKVSPFSDSYQNSADGIRHVESAIDDPTNFLHSYIRLGDESTENRSENSSQSENDYWIPLKIDRETPEFENAVTAIENVIETVQGDNGYAATEPEERSHILWSLNKGLEALKDALPSRNQIRALIVAPLNFLARKFAETSIGEIAKIAVAKLAALLMGLGS